MDKDAVVTMNHDQPPESLAWWRYGYVWLVIAGPAAVVLASMVTMWLAVTRPDPVLTDAAPQRDGVVVETQNLPVVRAQAPLAPAMQARNHLTVPAGTAAR